MIVYVIYVIVINGMGFGKLIDFVIVVYVVWFGVLSFCVLVFDLYVMLMFVLIVVILVVENFGYIKVVSVMMGINFDCYVGWVFIGDGFVMIVLGSVGGMGVIIYVENIGVMVVMWIYLMLVFVVVVLIVIGFGFLLKFGVVI